MKLKIVLFVSLIVIDQILAITEQCLTPEMDKGLCVPLYECPTLFKEFVVPPKGTENYLRQYICESSGEIKVCCSISLNFTVPLDEHLPSNIDMESGTYTTDAIQCIRSTAIDKVLPIVRVQNELGVVITNCRAPAINSIYLITLARCVVPNNKTENFTVLGIRLLMEKQKRCDDFDIEEIIPHPFYDSVNGLNDLAILKLSAPLSGDYVTFHCILDKYYTASYPSAQAVYDNRLNTVRPMPIEECKQIFHDKNITIMLTDYDICAKDISNSTDEYCNKYGLPLISDARAPVVYGISPYKRICGDGLPNVYTNVGSYADWFYENVQFRVDSEEQCTTPNKEEGRCRYVNRCPSVLQMFADTRKSTEAHLRGYICQLDGGHGGFISACCPQSPNSSSIKDIDEQKISDIPAQFLESYRCGLQHRDDYFSDDELAIDEYPWMALVLRSVEVSVRCTGVLINARYVLGAADCARAPASEITVRLGDYSRLNDTDCIVDKKIGYADCSDTEIFGVEEVVPHPFYMLPLSFNDIGLLRLNRTVTYTDYIRPICLPTPGTPIAKVGHTLYMSNWILYSHNIYKKNEGNIKTKVTAKIITNNKCRVIFRKKVFVHSSHLCALIDESNNTNENVHAAFFGGGLMFRNNYRWHVEGLPQLRILDDTPIISVNVSKYVNWILDNMRPW